MRQDCTLVNFLCVAEAALCSMLVFAIHHDHSLARGLALGHFLAVGRENFLRTHVELRVYFVLWPAPPIVRVQLQRFTNHARMVGARFNPVPRHHLVGGPLANLARSAQHWLLIRLDRRHL